MKMMIVIIILDHQVIITGKDKMALRWGNILVPRFGKEKRRANK